MRRLMLLLAALAWLVTAAPRSAPIRPIPPTAAAADSLIRTGEDHLAHLLATFLTVWRNERFRFSVPFLLPPPPPPSFDRHKRQQGDKHRQAEHQLTTDHGQGNPHDDAK